MAAGPLEGHTVAQAAHPHVRDPEAGAVHRDEPVDPALELGVEQVFDAPQVAKPLLPDRTHKSDTCPGSGDFRR